MKKSTLITTIAMIVVVVVALSTATYAWFSSASTSIASTSITTTGSADWVLTGGTVTTAAIETVDGTGSATFTGGASDSITLNATMASGLWAPTAAIDAAITEDATSEISGLATFIQAQTHKVSGATKTTLKAVKDNATAGNGYIVPDVIKVANASPSAAKTLRLSVIVNAGSDTSSTATLYAGAATSFYVTWQQVGVAEGLSGTATNGYSHKALDDNQALNADFESNTFTSVGKSNNVSAARPTYATVSASDYTQVGTQDAISAQDAAKYGLESDSYYLQYDITIGSVPGNAAVYVFIYTWIDGWVADANAAGASYSVNYAFIAA